MIPEYERYHGVVVRELIVRAPRAIKLEKRVDAGRVHSYCLNGRTALHIKHSSKRLPPWQFTFDSDNLSEVRRLERSARSLWFALICGTDGVVALSSKEFKSLTSAAPEATRFIRVNREPHTMYRVFGNGGGDPVLKPRGILAVIEDAFGMKAAQAC